MKSKRFKYLENNVYNSTKRFEKQLENFIFYLKNDYLPNIFDYFDKWVPDKKIRSWDELEEIYNMVDYLKQDFMNLRDEIDCIFKDYYKKNPINRIKNKIKNIFKNKENKK